MIRWPWSLLLICCAIMVAWGPADAKDRPHAKSLTRSALPAPASSRRSCTVADLLGSWTLVTFESSYRFKNPEAPYLFPYQVFHYSPDYGVKSAHSRTPFPDRSDRMFEVVPPNLTYHIDQDGRLLVKTKGQEAVVETWSCSVVEQDLHAKNDGTALRRGDLVMTLLGSHGHALFVRHLRKSAT